MSWQLVGRVIERRFKSSSSKLLMVVLAEWCNDDGLATYPRSKAQFADVTHLSSRQVQRLFAELVEAGLVEIVHEADLASRRPRTYRINIDRLLELPLTSTAQAIRERAKRKTQRDKVSPQGETESRKSGDTESQRDDSVSPTVPFTPKDTPCARETDAQQETQKDKASVPRETDPEAKANEIWSAASDAIKAEIKDRNWDAWLKNAVPISDNGKTFVLGLETETMVKHVQQYFSEVIARRIDREVELIVRNASAHETSKRRAKRRQEASSAHDTAAQPTGPRKSGTHG